IHKTLLSSLSAELHKHVNNDMKEGKENLIELSEVDEPTLEAFLEWAYFQDYIQWVASPLPKTSAALPYHTKIYVLADRFNIPVLKDLAFSKITALLAELGMVAERADLVSIVTAVTYAYDNLLAHSGSPSSTPERLLRYFTQYISWALDSFRSNDEFFTLLASNSEFAEALVVNCSPALTPPWVMDMIAGASKSKSASTETEKIVLDATDSSHVLYNECTCGYRGVMGIQCSSCENFDDHVGMNVEFHGSLLGTVGASRISGTRTNYNYTCI
ncbi:hypothetical protein EV426DRAFT_539193, partial [Tirmania nivea]